MRLTSLPMSTGNYEQSRYRMSTIWPGFFLGLYQQVGPICRCRRFVTWAGKAPHFTVFYYTFASDWMPKMLAGVGFGPTIRRPPDSELDAAKMVAGVGFEPTTFRL